MRMLDEFEANLIDKVLDSWSFDQLMDFLDVDPKDVIVTMLEDELILMQDLEELVVN